MDLKDVLARTWTELDDNKNVGALDQFFAPDYVRHGRRSYTRDEFKQMLRELHIGFPDLEMVSLDMVREENRIAYRWESVGTHLGPYLGALPTRRRIRAYGITISRFEDGVIAEDWASWNEVSVLHDLGILPIDR